MSDKADPVAFWREQAQYWRDHAATWQDHLDERGGTPEADAAYRKIVHTCLGMAVVCDQSVAYHEKYPPPVAAAKARQEGDGNGDPAD